MGTWGTGLYANDTAEDALNDFRDVFSVKEPEEGTRILIEHYVDIGNLLLFTDEFVDFWLALADFQWNKGILLDNVKEKALEIIDSGAGLESWIEEGNKTDIKNRKKVLEDLRNKLNSPQPERKKIKNSCMHTRYKVGDIVALKPNEKLTYGKQCLPYFNKDNKDSVKDMLNSYYNGNGLTLSFSDDYEPIINAENYFLMICVKTEKSFYNNGLVPELYNEYAYFTFLDYYSPTLDGVENKIDQLKLFKTFENYESVFKYQTTYVIPHFGFTKVKKICNSQKLVEEIKKLETEIDFSGFGMTLSNFLESYEIVNNDKIKFTGESAKFETGDIVRYQLGEKEFEKFIRRRDYLSENVVHDLKSVFDGTNIYMIKIYDKEYAFDKSWDIEEARKRNQTWHNEYFAVLKNFKKEPLTKEELYSADIRFDYFIELDYGEKRRQDCLVFRFTDSNGMFSDGEFINLEEYVVVDNDKQLAKKLIDEHSLNIEQQIEENRNYDSRIASKYHIGERPIMYAIKYMCPEINMFLF